jgi:hypothetical protein
MSAAVSELFMIDTGLRLTVAAERYGVVRCSRDAGSADLVHESRIVLGEDLGCPECLQPHRIQPLEDAIALGAINLEEDVIALGFVEILRTTTASLRNQLRRRSSPRSASAA